MLVDRTDCIAEVPRKSSSSRPLCLELFCSVIFSEKSLCCLDMFNDDMKSSLLRSAPEGDTDDVSGVVIKAGTFESSEQPFKRSSIEGCWDLLLEGAMGKVDIRESLCSWYSGGGSTKDEEAGTTFLAPPGKICLGTAPEEDVDRPLPLAVEEGAPKPRFRKSSS